MKNTFANARSVKQIRKVLSKDYDWPLVSGGIKAETKNDQNTKRRALARITKQAVRMLFSNDKVSVRCGSDTARHWVYVEITSSTPKRNTGQQVENILVSLGMKYATYLSDYGTGGDIRAPCLSINFKRKS